LLGHAKSTIAERAAAPSEVFICESIPVTGVGKVFKPELRLDAARRALQAALAMVGDGAATFDILVGTDPRYGMLAQIVATRQADARSLEGAVREALDRLTVRYEITWKEQRA
jgi:fatty-acyl-CoA synthase